MQHSAQNRPTSEVPTLSSFYSQPSPEIDNHDRYRPSSPPRSSSLYPDDISVSPPESPNVMGEHHNPGRLSPDVSPISATPSPTASSSPALYSSGSRRYSSNLPLPKSNTKKFWKLPGSAKGSEHPESSTVRWDEYSGEPTAGDRGKPPSATPGSIKLRETPTPLRLRPNFGTSTTITSNNAPARKRVGGREISEPPIMIRPEWKGAGGRHSIVKPLFDKPLEPGQAKEFPAGYNKQWLEEQDRERMEIGQDTRAQGEHDSTGMTQQGIQDREEAAEMARKANERAAQEQREREREQQSRMARVRIEKAKREREKILHAQEESERRAKERTEKLPQSGSPEPLYIPSQASLGSPQNSALPPSTMPPSDSNPRQKLRNSTTSTPEPPSLTVSNPRTRVGSPIQDDMTSPLARNPNTEEMRQRRNQALPDPPSSKESSPVVSSIMERPAPSINYHTSQDRSAGLQDPDTIEARFRSNLQNMTISDQPQSRFSATTVATTADDNSPPQTPEIAYDITPPSNTPNSILNRKRPVAPAGLIKRKPTPSQAGTPNGVTRKDSKSLPRPPPDAEVLDPIQTLQAKVDVLRRRRRNLETVIHELTNVVQPSSIAYDRTSRAEIKKTVAGLDKELSEVVKDEHETGLKLHRAWKRHEDFAAYEPTSIWVRRVTN